jgi:hypothetical protein
MTLPMEHPSAPTIDLCTSPIPACANSSSTPSKNQLITIFVLRMIIKINWGKRKQIFLAF